RAALSQPKPTVPACRWSTTMTCKAIRVIQLPKPETVSPAQNQRKARRSAAVIASAYHNPPDGRLSATAGVFGHGSSPLLTGPVLCSQRQMGDLRCPFAEYQPGHPVADEWAHRETTGAEPRGQPQS